MPCILLTNDDGMDAHHEGGKFHRHNRIWERMASDDEHPDPHGTDRRAIEDGYASVSPLTVPHVSERHGALDSFADEAVTAADDWTSLVDSLAVR